MAQQLEERKSRIMPGGKAMILAYDQGFEHGPRDFLEHSQSANFEYILDKESGTGLIRQLTTDNVTEIAMERYDRVAAVYDFCEVITEKFGWDKCGSLYGVKWRVSIF